MKQILTILAKLFSISLLRYFIIAGIPFLICYIIMQDRMSSSKIQGRHARVKDYLREILHSLQTTSVFVMLAYFLLFTSIRQYTSIYPMLSQRDWWYLPLSVLISLVIHDTYFYWMHRLMHHPRLFRHSHLLHHLSTNPSPWTSYSFHITEAFTEGFILVIIVFIVPMHQVGVLFFTIVAFMINVYGHLGYEIVPIWFRDTILFKVLNTSIHHNLHHSKFKGNYGLYFRMWDKWMGTEYPDYEKEFDRIQQRRFPN